MWGRIIVCERGYKAEHVRVESPVVVDMDCEWGCQEPVARILVPTFGSGSYWAQCETHAGMSLSEGLRDGSQPTVAVEARTWTREACRELSDRYKVQVISYL
jgi:hypothetical protein